ncbi:hypothetical protein [Methylobacterium sp. Leaf118]|uniref:hypothetical protein n=1 Tax=Methylobacterium sp. Leaf118 TaxID=2876562 RepID=UPI001E478D50|nr:hypothetical protein [Methylobacterium sp. Leaf118]
MPNPDSTSAFLDGRSVAPTQRAMQYAYLWVLASLVTALGLLALGYAVSARSDHEAGRMIIAAQNGTGYGAILVSGLAARHGHPGR